MISNLVSVASGNSSFSNLTISEDENVHYHVDIANRRCTSFPFGSFEENQFRCLISILGLLSPSHAEIRLKLLSPLDKKSDVKKSRYRPESAGGLLTASVQLERT
ncbi:unnamed protein product [Hymenolepis diminuta]|uniref:Uncharacterized protein n=1 Tax=Hymenolepis diminuta TaxID=6216 RepID=A0A0R3SX91_HYMDI|nr:unnamed protein product [Hymenolepis diminuta]